MHEMRHPKLKKPNLEAPLLKPIGTHDEGAFIMTVEATGDKKFKIPIYNGGTYNFVVQWGDGNQDVITAYDDAAVEHTYAADGFYRVDIHGTIEGFRFNDPGFFDGDLLIEIRQWGNLVLGNLGSYFMGCENLHSITAPDLPNLEGMTDFSSMFEDCGKLESIHRLNEWAVTAPLDTNSMFQGCVLLNPQVSAWDMSSNLDMSNMFSLCAAFDQDLSGWDVSACTTLSGLFNGCELFNSDLSLWETGECLYLTSTFKGCLLFDQDLSGWDVSKVISFNGTFQNCAFNQDISGWVTSAAENFQNTFRDNTAFDQDIGGWDIATVFTMTNMFNGATLSTANYDELLKGWEGGTHLSNVTFHAGINSKYSPGLPAIAKAALETDGWTITDGGQAV